MFLLFGTPQMLAVSLKLFFAKFFQYPHVSVGFDQLISPGLDFAVERLFLLVDDVLFGAKLQLVASGGEQRFEIDGTLAAMLARGFKELVEVVVDFVAAAIQDGFGLYGFGEAVAPLVANRFAEFQ